MYCIVKEDTNAISGIPMSWLFKNNRYMKWPKTRNVSQLIKQKAEPQSDWKKYACTVIKTNIGKQFINLFLLKF